MLEHPKAVDAAFIHKHCDGRRLSSIQKINARCDVAKSLLTQTYSHLIAGLEERATDQHNAAIEEWNLILDDISFAEDVPRYVFFPHDFRPLSLIAAYVVPATTSSMLFTHFSRQLGLTPTAMFR
jgi:hypothetical protein